MNPNKSYRIRTTPQSGDSVKLNVTLNQDFDFIDILSLKLDQTNVYRTPRAEYGCIVGRVMANGGVGVPNARVSIFIPVSESTKRDIEKRVLYPYETSADKNFKNIRYNLFQDENINECHQAIGSFPLKRAILDNNDILEIFDEYYKYTTVTNSSGDYMLFGVPIGSNQIHCDIDLSDCGHLSQMPRDMYYKGYSLEQFESSTQFKKDSNLDNLAQVFTEDSAVYVYPFWGNTNEDEVGITRYDINISYKFESTCVFIGSVVTDSDNATTYASCLPQETLGNMNEMTTKQGTIEMIRLEPDGRIINFKIKGNQLIDGDGVWCYQIPMNLDYFTTDEFGNEILSDNPSIGIPTRTDVRFKIKIEQPAELHKMKACYLVPHNPDTYDDIDYTFGKDTPKTQFVSLFKNNVYSVKSYIPRLQMSGSATTLNHTGIKSVENFGSNLPFPYNSIRGQLPLQFVLLCAISMIVIMFQEVWNRFITNLTCMATGICIGLINIGRPINIRLNLCIDIGAALRPIFCTSSMKCYHMDPSWCQYLNILVFPNCDYDCSRRDGRACPNRRFIWIGGQCNLQTPEGCTAIRDNVNQVIEEYEPDTHIKDAELIKDCVITTLAEDIGVSKFNFTNDWINGVLYFPTFNYKKRRVRRRKFLGIFGKKRERIYEDVCSFEEETTMHVIDNRQSIIYSRGVRQLRLFKSCSPLFSKNKQHLELNVDNIPRTRSGYITRGCYDNSYEDDNKSAGAIGFADRRSRANKCHEASSHVMIRQPFINREVVGEELGADKDKDGEPIYEYYYRPICSADEININLFKTDVILLGSLEDCNKHGIWDLYKELPITTYQMPGPMYEIDYKITTEKRNNKDVAVIDFSNSLYIGSGKNWGYGGGKNIRDAHRRMGNYRFYSQNTSGGLFYGIGCSSFETKIKTCVNLERICQLGVELDLFMSVDGVCANAGMENNVITPQGFIGRDQLIRGVETRQKFATLNQRKLNRYTVQDKNNPEVLKENLISSEGKKYYDFDYIYPSNFDGRLSGTFNERTAPVNVRQTRTNTAYSNTRNESYIDPEYFRFRYGVSTLDNNGTPMNFDRISSANPDFALENNPTNVGFFQPVNSFYFYFGIKSGSTAIEKLRQKFAAKCFQQTDEEVQIQVNVVHHPFICSCNDRPHRIPEPSIRIEVVGAMTDYYIEIRDNQGNPVLPETKYTTDESPITLRGSTIPEFHNEGTFFVNFRDDNGNISQSTFTLRFRNRVFFSLNEVRPIFDSVSPGVICLPNDTTSNNAAIFKRNERESCALVLLENIGGITTKNCRLGDYNLRINWRETNIGRDAQFKININSQGSVSVSRENGGNGYKVGAFGQVGNGGVYIRVTSVNNGTISNFVATNQFGGTELSESGYSNGDIFTVENMKMFNAVERTYNIPDRYNNCYHGNCECHGDHQCPPPPNDCQCPPNHKHSEDERIERERETNRRQWQGFELYLCVGEYTICLESKHGNCKDRDTSCQFIAIGVRPGVSLTFRNDLVSAKYFKGQVINNIPRSPRDDEWWSEFFKFLRETLGKNEETLLEELGKWYSFADNITTENVKEYIDLFREMWMPMCSNDVPVIYLRGTGHSPPMRTLLYGAIRINNLLCASDTLSSLHQTGIYRFNDIPYQTQQSTKQGLVQSYRIRDDQGGLHTTPVAVNNIATRSNLTPEEGLTFTTIRIPIEKEYPNYRTGGFYAGVIGQDGAGRGAGYDSSLTTTILNLQKDNPTDRITAWELLHGKNGEDGIIGNSNEEWNTNAKKYLFKFHILDQTLKIFNQWNRIAAAHRGYIDPGGCTKRDIPAYFDVFYVNGPPRTELTMGVENSPFDVVGMEWKESILRGVMPDIDRAIDILENLKEDQEPPDGLEYVSISTGISDDRTHLGSCPRLVPTAKHFYSTSRFTGDGASIEQRVVTPIIVDGVEEDDVNVLCSDTAVAGLDLEVSNTGVRVSSFFNNCGTITNYYSHSIEISNLDTTILNTILSGNWGGVLDLYELYQMRYVTPIQTCSGAGAAIFWRIEEGEPRSFMSIFSLRRRTTNNAAYISRFRLISRGGGYKIGDRYTILSDSNNELPNINTFIDPITVFVTGSVVRINITNSPYFDKNRTIFLRGNAIEVNGGGIQGASIDLTNDRDSNFPNHPSGSNPPSIRSNVGEGSRARIRDDFRVAGNNLLIVQFNQYFQLPAGWFEFELELNEDGEETGRHRVSQINLNRSFFNYGSGYIAEPRVEINLFHREETQNQSGDRVVTYPVITTVVGTGILGSNYFETDYNNQNINDDPVRSREIFDTEPAKIPGFSTINVTGVGSGTRRVRTEDENGRVTIEDVPIDGMLYSYVIVKGVRVNNTITFNFINAITIEELSTRGQILRKTEAKRGRFFWQRRERGYTEWMSDLFCNRNQGNNITSATTNPEDLLHYMSSDDWHRRFNFPYYTRNYPNNSYAEMNPQVDEPPYNLTTSCHRPLPPVTNPPTLPHGAFEIDGSDYTMGTRKHNITITDLSNQKRTTTPTLFLPFNGVVTAGSPDTIFYNILHDNQTAVRAFTQPLDFGNYIFIDASSIIYSQITPNNYTISFDIEIRGTNAYKQHGYDIVVEEGRFNTNKEHGSIFLQANNGFDLLDTPPVNENTMIPNDSPLRNIPALNSIINTMGNIQRDTGLVLNGRWIKLEGQINRWTFGIPGTTDIPKTKIPVNNFSSTDINRIVRISATDVTGVEIYTYISLFRWIDTHPQLTYCVYKCNKEIEKALNTGLVIDFEMRGRINDTRLVGKKVAYLTRFPFFPENATNPVPVITQGKNLIHTHAFDPTDENNKRTILSDGTILPRNYRGSLYLWFNNDWFPDDPEIEIYDDLDFSTQELKNEEYTKIEVTASSCYISYKIIL